MSKKNALLLSLLFCASIGGAGCAGISDCKDDGAKCAEMLNANAERCALAFQLQQGDPKRKHCSEAIKTVAKQKIAAALPGLIQILKSPESAAPYDEHRQEAAQALARIQDKSAVDALLEVIDFSAGTSSDPRDKNANRSNEIIAESLGKLGDTRACGKLIELMEKSRYDYAILKSIRALGSLQCKEAVESVAKVALTHENKFMRKNAIISLGDIGDLRGAEALIQMMFVEYQGVSFYREASFSLFQLGTGVSERLLATMAGQNEQVKKYFEAKGGMMETAVKAKCGFVLGDLRDPRAVTPLMEAFQEAAKNTEDPGSRILMAYASSPLGMLGDRKAVPILQKEMLVLDASVREPVMRALVQLGSRSVVPDMIKGMTKEHFMQECLKIAPQDACEGDKASLVGAQKAAGDAAASLAGPEHLDAYKKAAETAEGPAKDYLVARVARVEAAVACKQDATCWSAKLKDANPLVREKAAWELGWLKDKSTIGALKEALKDTDTFVRAAAISAYWGFGDETAVPEIEKQLEDEAGSSTFIRVNEDLKRLLVHLKRQKTTSV